MLIDYGFVKNQAKSFKNLVDNQIGN